MIVQLISLAAIAILFIVCFTRVLVHTKTVRLASMFGMAISFVAVLGAASMLVLIDQDKLQPTHVYQPDEGYYRLPPGDTTAEPKGFIEVQWTGWDTWQKQNGVYLTRKQLDSLLLSRTDTVFLTH